jgi:hypothetical protein
MKLADVMSCQAVDAERAIVINDAIRIPFCQKTSTEEEFKRGSQGVFLLGDALSTIFFGGDLPIRLSNWNVRDQ